MPLDRLIHLNTKECLWIYILSLLQKGGMHAYLIRKEIERTFGFSPGTMTAYKVLYLLHRKGYVSRKSLGRRNVYTLTPKGKQELVKASRYYRKLSDKLL